MATRCYNCSNEIRQSSRFDPLFECRVPFTSFQLPDSADHVVIAANRRAGRGSTWHTVEHLVGLLAQRGFTAEVITDLAAVTTRAVDLHSQARLRAVVAAGGDGTNAEIVNRMPAEVPLALMPLGTENLLAKYLCVPFTVEAVVDCLSQGTAVRLDAARAGERIFLLMADIGFDADVVNRLHETRTGNISRFSYIKPILDSIRSYEYPALRIYCDSGQGWDAEPLVARWVFLFNLPCYCAGLKVAPGAIGTDGLLDLFAFQGAGFWNGIRYLLGVLSGRHAGFRDCVTRRVRRVRIESDQPAPYQLDGDPGGRLPLEVEILPERLTVVVPQAWAQRQE